MLNNKAYELYNKDCIETMDKLIADGIQVDCIITDPPYRVISGGRPKAHSNQPSGMLSKNDGKIFEYNEVKADEWFPRIYNMLKDDSQCYVFTNTINMYEYLTLANKVGFKLHSILVWEKNNCTPSRWYMKNAEWVLFLRKGKAKTIHNVGSKMVHQFDNILGKKTHPCEKPVDLLQFYIENSTKKGDIVFDPFMGSGSCGVATLNTNRKFIGIEIDDTYFKIAERRISETC